MDKIKVLDSTTLKSDISLEALDGLEAFVKENKEALEAEGWKISSLKVNCNWDECSLIINGMRDECDEELALRRELEERKLAVQEKKVERETCARDEIRCRIYGEEEL